MKLEHKIGIAITCTFLCLGGAVIGLKLHEQESAEAPRVASANAPSSEEKPAHSHGSKVKEDDDTNSEKKHSSTKKTPTPPEPPLSPLPSGSSSASPAGSTHSRSGDNALTPPFTLSTPAPGSEGEKNKATRPGDDSHIKTSLIPKESPNIRKSGGGSLENAAPPGPVEPQPIAPPVGGANEWDKAPAGGGNAKKQPKPDSTMKPAGPASAASSASQAKEPPGSPPPLGPITPTGAQGPIPLDSLSLPKGPSTPPSPGATPTPTPIGSGTIPAPISSAANNSGMKPSGNQLSTPSNDKGITSSLPPFMPEKPANSTKPADPTVKEKITVFPSPLEKPGTPPSPSVAPAPPKSPPVEPPFTPSAPPPAGLSVSPPSGPGATTAPPINPSPPPSIPPEPPAAPSAPAPALKPLTPPKPPADGSGYIEDPLSPAPGSAASSAPASGRLSAIPAPLPLTPSSSPLASAGTRTPSGQPPASTGPSVKVFDEIEYVCQPNDTYESISKKFFLGSPNYAKALQRHNQNHARASEQMQKAGMLKPGEKIYVPQAGILEERYADAIDKPGRTIVPASGTSAPTNP